MKLIVNGDEQVLENVKVLSDLVTVYKLDDKLVVAEVDGQVVDRSEWDGFSISEGMTIELVHFVGGG